MKKALALILAVLMLTACLTGCGGSSAAGSQAASTTASGDTFELEGVTYSYADYPKSDIVIAKVNTNNQNAWRAAMMKAWEDCCEEMKSVGLIGDYLTYNVQGEEAGIAAIQDAINKGVDALCLQCGGETYGPIIQEALDAGIKVINTGFAGLADQAGQNFIVLDGDNDEYMRGPVEAMCGMMGYEGKIIHFYGLEGGWDGGEIRKAAVRDVIAKYPNMEIIHGEPCSWSPATANSAMTTLLAAYGKDLCGEHVGIVGEDVGLGVLQAYEAAGYGDDLPVILGDYTIGFMRAWAQHPDLKAVCNCYAADYTYTFAHIAYMMCNGFELDQEKCHFERGNADWYLVCPMPCVVVKEYDPDAEWVKNLLPTTEVRLLDDVLAWADENNLSDNDCILGHNTIAEVQEMYFK